MKASQIDRFFSLNRRVASAITPWLARTPLKPNHVTTLALACGLLAAYCMSLGTRSAMALGALLLQGSYIADNCDGDLARLKSLKSEFGMWYDYLADVAVEFALWIGLAAAALRHGVASWISAVAIAACAGSLINFARVVSERGQNIETAVPRHAIDRSLAALGKDGDPTLFVWIMAIIGYPEFFLIAGCVYIYIIALFAASQWIGAGPKRISR